MNIKMVLLGAAMIVLASCSKSKVEEIPGNNNAPGIVTAAGYGNSSLPFTSPSWKLPVGIDMKDSIHEYSYCWAFPPNTNVEPKEWKGVPLGFSFCLTLKNNTAAPIIIQFPPQLVFASAASLHQNVLTIELGVMELPAGTATTIVAQGFCINKGRHGPDVFVDGTSDLLAYSFGPASIPAPLQEIVDIIRSKHITINNVLKADGTIDTDKVVKYSVIQKAIWEVTDGPGLTVNTKNELTAL